MSKKKKEEEYYRPKKKHLSGWDKAFYTGNFIFMLAFVVITLYPILNTLAISFNDGIDAVRGGIHLWPRVFSIKNYQTVLGIQGFRTIRRNVDGGQTEGAGKDDGSGPGSGTEVRKQMDRAQGR